jgi:ATPase involved in DNA replication initiation
MKSLEQIAEYIRLATGFDIVALRTKNRNTYRVAARQLFCYYARLSGYSLKVAGTFLCIDHATVLHGSRRVKEMKDTDEIFKTYIKKYEMSGKKQIVELVPPDYGRTEESSEFSGFVCPHCNGQGHVMDYGVKEQSKIDCPRCGGSGKLRAKVQITWEAEERKKEV